jgi:hypothetical protein
MPKLPEKGESPNLLGFENLTGLSPEKLKDKGQRKHNIK